MRPPEAGGGRQWGKEKGCGSAVRHKDMGMGRQDRMDALGCK